jgi:glycosyltransferase involved in cell wall biosynthesis
MMKTPRISLVTPSYNQAAFLENTLLSVLEQGYPNLEYIVMDGGSTDGSVEIIQKYARHITYWQSQPDGGQVAALNAAFERATGDIFGFLNSDDFLLQGALRHILDLYIQHPQAAGWVGGGQSIFWDGYILNTRPPQKIERDDLANWEENWFYQPACFFSAGLARKAGPIDVQYNNAFDFDYWMRLTELGELVPTQHILAAATTHPDAKTQKYHAHMFEEVQDIQRRYGYADLALGTQSFIDQARHQTHTSTVARLIYLVNSEKKKDPGRFIRFPEKTGKA